MKIHTDRLLVLLPLILVILFFLPSVTAYTFLRYNKIEACLLFLLPPFMGLIYTIPTINTWKKCLIYSFLISLLCFLPIKYSTYIALICTIPMILVSTPNVLRVKCKVDTWKKCLAYSLVPLFCVALFDFFNGDFVFTRLVFSIYSIQLVLGFCLDFFMKKQGRNEQEKIPFHARLNIDLNFQNFRKFIIVILLFYIAFAVIYRFMYRPFEQIHASGVFALSIFSLFLIFPAVALQPVRAILTCLILPLFWSVMLYCIYALLVRFVSNAESYFDDRPVIYQRLISQISDPEFYVKYYFEFDRWFISFPLLAIWAVYYWLKKSELRREVTTKNKP